MVKRLFPLLIILIVWFIFSYPAFLQNKIAFPADYQVNHFSPWNQYENFWGPVKNPAMPDVVGQLYPWKKFTIESLKNREIPFWDPYTMSGTPHLANYQSAVFSPTNIFYFIFDFKNAWNLAVVIQPLLAGIFTYLFARSLRLGKSASVLSSVSFMFCGFITTWMNYTTLSLAISFLPLALFSIEKYLSKNNILWLLILTVSISFSFLSGHFQTSLYLGIFVYGYIIFKTLISKNLPNFLYLNLFYFLGILIASSQILATMEFYVNSFRSKNFEKINPLPLSHLPLIIAPDFYGNPVTRNNFSLIYAEYSLFAGTVPFFLSIINLFSKNKTAYFFIITAVASLILGLNTPLTDLLVGAKIPVISTSSISRILVIFSFSIAILAGFGLEVIIKYLNEKNYKKIIIWFLAGAVILGLTWMFILLKQIDPRYYSIALKNLILPSGMFLGLFVSTYIGFKKSFVKISILLIVLFTIFDMLRFAVKWQPYTSKDLVFPQVPITKEITKLDKIYRTHAPFGAEASLYYNLPSTEGYNPLYINRYGQFIASMESGEVKSSPRYTVLLPLNTTNLNKGVDLLGIKHILIKKSDLGQPWVFPVSVFSTNKFSEKYEDDKFIIYDNAEVFPRAVLVGDYEIETNEQKILDRILDKNLDLRKKVILEKSPGIERTSDFVGDAKIISYSPNNIKLNTNSNTDSVLLLTDNFYPAWKVKVNGEEGKILRANYTFRAVPLPKGNNSVEFYYGSDMFNWGIYLTIFSAVSILAIIAVSWYTKSKWNKRVETAKSASKSYTEIADLKRIRKGQKKSKKAN